MFLKWHVIYGRDMTEEEWKYYKSKYDYDFVDYILCDAPEDGEEVLTSIGTIDTFIDDEDGCCWESGNEVEIGQKWCSINEILDVLNYEE